MKNTLIYLLGFPGTGKYTIAKEICAIEDIKLVDNHLINIPLFSLIPNDGVSPLPERIWDNVGLVWDAVLDTITHISPPDYSFVLTNALSNENEQDRHWFNKVKLACESKNRTFVPVRLLCSVEENTKRIVSPERKARMKDINPLSPQKNAANHSVLDTDHPNILTLDVSDISAKMAAKTIINHARRVAKPAYTG